MEHGTETDRVAIEKLIAAEDAAWAHATRLRIFRDDYRVRLGADVLSPHTAEVPLFATRMRRGALSDVR